MKNSKQRDLVLKTLQENPVHPTAEYLYSIIKKEMPSISLATVYRNLNLLAENNIIKKIEALDGSRHFDHNLYQHHHFICIKCNKVYDVAHDVMPNLNEKSLKDRGLQVLDYDLSLRGICYNCQQKH